MNSSLAVNDTVWVSNTQQVKVVKLLDVGYIQPPNSEYIVETADNRIEVYEVETVGSCCREIMVSDNATCWLWGNVDEAEVAREHCDLLERANVNPLDLIDQIDNADLRDYVREVVELANAETTDEEK